MWNTSSDEEIFDEPHVQDAAPIPVIQPCHTAVNNSDPCSSYNSDFNADPVPRPDNSPSFFSVVVDQVNISTPMPSPELPSCGDINCKGEFCIGHDQIVNNIKSTTTPIYIVKNAKRKCIKNTAETFSQAQLSDTQIETDMCPTLSITPTISLREESGENSYIEKDSNEMDSDNFSSPFNYETGVSSSRSSKKPLKGPSEWAHNKRKRLKNLGQEYCTKDGKIMPKKTLKPPCTCRFKCYEKINDTQRRIVFENFWQLGDRQKQWSYLVKYVKKVKKNRTLNTDIPNNRLFTFKYHLPLAEKSDELQVLVVDVCKIMFINTLEISDKMIRTAWEKYDGDSEIEEDKRGRHDNHKKVITEDMIQSVVDHVNALASNESSYFREKTDKLYLEGSPSIPRMFQLYNEWVDSERYTTKATTERQYREIVRKHFNLGVYIPKKGQCFFWE